MRRFSSLMLSIRALLDPLAPPNRMPNQVIDEGSDVMTRDTTDARTKRSLSILASRMLLYNSTSAPTLALSNTLVYAQCNDSVDTRIIATALDPTVWAGRSIKIQIVATVNGTSAGNLNARLCVAYRNTALDGISTTSYTAGSSNGTLNNSAFAVTAPTVASAPLLIESDSMTIPSNVTALSVQCGFERTSGADTNTDVAYIAECRIIEQ